MLSFEFELGLQKPLYIRTIKLREQQDACRILYISDIHLRRRRSTLLCDQILQAARVALPDLIVLGGDLMDRSTEVDSLRHLVGQLREWGPVFAVLGNHDVSLGISLVREALESAGAVCLQEHRQEVEIRSRVISLFGPEAIHITETTAVPSADRVRVLCTHNPRDWKKSQDLRFDLVLAGHLHGCQLVAFEFRDRLYPGAWFYPYCYLAHRKKESLLVVSRGVSDLVPIRWRCPREVVLCLV